MKKTNNLSHTRYAAGIGVFSALAYLTTLVCKLIPDVEGFLSLDAKDAVISIAAFIFGPLSAPIISLIVCFVEMITISSTSWYGFVMNLASSTVFSLTASLIYKKGKSYNSAILGFFMSVVLVVSVMLCLNTLITPLYFGFPRSVVVDMIPDVLFPFNLAKSLINSALALLLYKPIINSLRAARLIPRGEHRTQFNKNTVITIVIGSLLIVASVIILLYI